MIRFTNENYWKMDTEEEVELLRNLGCEVEDEMLREILEC